MDYCGPRGIPHSIFMGRAPRKGEPYWLDSDREKAVKWSERDRSRCSGCGTPPEDWNPARGGSPEAYTVAQDMCEGCRQRDIATAEMEGMHELFRRGLRTYIVPNTSLPMWQYP